MSELAEIKDHMGCKHHDLHSKVDADTRELRAKMDFIEAETHDMIQFKSKMTELLPSLADKDNNLQNFRNLLVLITSMQSEIMAAMKGLGASISSIESKEQKLQRINKTMLSLTLYNQKMVMENSTMKPEEMEKVLVTCEQLRNDLEVMGLDCDLPKIVPTDRTIKQALLEDLATSNSGDAGQGERNIMSNGSMYMNSEVKSDALTSQPQSRDEKTRVKEKGLKNSMSDVYRQSSNSPIDGIEPTPKVKIDDTQQSAQDSHDGPHQAKFKLQPEITSKPSSAKRITKG